jgi:hypothetical protein
MAATHAGQITFAEGIDLVSRFLNPVLAGPITGTWNPERSRWRNTSK